MPYQVKGAALDVFNAFNLKWGVEDYNYAESNPITPDLHRTPFLGNSQQARDHLNAWTDCADKKYYVQGNMSASNLYLLFGADHIFSKYKHNNADWFEKYISISFAYVNKNKELCGLTFIANRNQPTFWFMGLIEKTNLPPENREITLVTSFDPKDTNPNVSYETVEPESNPLEEYINHDIVNQLMANAINIETNECNLMYGRLFLLLRTLNRHDTDHPINDEIPLLELGPKILAEDNRALDYAELYRIHLSTANLRECLTPNSKLRMALEDLQLSNNYQRDSHYLRMFLTLYEAGVADLSKVFWVDYELVSRVSQLLLSEHRLLIINLINKQYNLQLFKLMISRNAYFSCFPWLIQYGLNEKKIQELYSQNNKLEALEYINFLDDKIAKELCLIFWVKTDFTMLEYQALVAELNQNPGLAQTLITMDQTKNISIPDLKICAFNAVKRQIKMITHEFDEEFKCNEIAKHQIHYLSEIESEQELRAIINSFKVLHEVTLTNSKRAYSAVLKNDNEGKLARLFLPQFSEVSDLTMRQALIEIFLTGLTKGAVSQAIAVKAITGPDELIHMAKDLHERFLCASQIQDLNFDDDILNFAAGKDEMASRFRGIILRVEEECKRVHQRVAQSWDPNRLKIIRDWQEVHENYRRTLYELAYIELTAELESDIEDVKKIIAKAEALVLKAVDPEIKSWVYGVLVVIANILITSLTLGTANYFKEKYTGNYWFFNRTLSGERLSALDIEVLDIIAAP